ncbi:MAG: RND transporter, partial [Candidatus Kapabacteria bacterium]|nr:RND transporter [Candidatus Kapabacteria bacterium]
VISVANIGEQRPNSDSKVFEVRIEVFEKDTTLRPAMTTSNRIVAATVDNVLSVPLECIHTENGKTYIYCKDGSKVVKQEVNVGLLSENDAIIERGISESSEIFLSLPTDYANASVNFLK